MTENNQIFTGLIIECDNKFAYIYWVDIILACWYISRKIKCWGLASNTISGQFHSYIRIERVSLHISIITSTSLRYMAHRYKPKTKSDTESRILLEFTQTIIDSVEFNGNWIISNMSGIDQFFCSCLSLEHFTGLEILILHGWIWYVAEKKIITVASSMLRFGI